MKFGDVVLYTVLLTPATENDIILLKRAGIDDPKPILTNLLRPTGRIHTHRGVIDHTSLIGKEIRDVVYTNKGVAYRIHQPTLAEYVRLSPRMVTPVWTSISFLECLRSLLIMELVGVSSRCKPNCFLTGHPSVNKFRGRCER